MPRFRRSFRPRRRKLISQPIQHSPALMGNNPNNNVGLLHVLAHAGVLAGGSMGSTRSGGEDRLTEVDNGRHVGNMNINLAFTTVAAGTGYYEYALVKYERSTTVPIIGTDPVPASAVIVTDGLQNAVRSLSPGYLIQYGQIAVTPQTTRLKIIRANWSKFDKSLVRDGDYFCLIIFNRSDGQSSYDIQTRYRTFNLK